LSDKRSEKERAVTGCWLLYIPAHVLGVPDDENGDFQKGGVWPTRKKYSNGLSQ
jgi:hypothetical protein